MGTVLIEIRAAEGGDDAKALVHEQFGVYVKMGVRRCL
jgi:protein subunit release factor A